jgi:hypothetical protein
VLLLFYHWWYKEPLTLLRSCDKSVRLGPLVRALITLSSTKWGFEIAISYFTLRGFSEPVRAFPLENRGLAVGSGDMVGGVLRGYYTEELNMYA